MREAFRGLFELAPDTETRKDVAFAALVLELGTDETDLLEEALEALARAADKITGHMMERTM